AMRTGRPNLIPSESDLTAPSTPPPAMVTEEVARTAVELAMKVADVLLQVIKKRQPWIRVPEDAGSADGRPNRALWSGNKAVAEITIGGRHGRVSDTLCRLRWRPRFLSELSRSWLRVSPGI